MPLTFLLISFLVFLAFTAKSWGGYRLLSPATLARPSKRHLWKINIPGLQFLTFDFPRSHQIIISFPAGKRHFHLFLHILLASCTWVKSPKKAISHFHIFFYCFLPWDVSAFMALRCLTGLECLWWANPLNHRLKEIGKTRPHQVVISSASSTDLNVFLLAWWYASTGLWGSVRMVPEKWRKRYASE